MNALQILIGIYVVINLINIVIATIQYLHERNSAQKTILLYWIGHFIAVMANAVFQGNDMRFGTVVTLGIFVTNFFLGSFFAKIHGIKVAVAPQIVFYLICYSLAWLLFFMGKGYVLYGTIGLLGSVSPLAVNLYKVLKYKKKPLTMIQKIFVGLCIFMIIHWLDAPYFRLKPDLYFIGTCIALSVLHILSILTPIMGTEHTLQLRNDHLEEEVREKVDQLTTAEISLWESNKLASLGQLSGGVAHEINNPLQVIVLHTDTLRVKAEEGKLSSVDVIEATTCIENMIDRITKITDSLRKIARDHRTVEMQENDLLEIVKETIVLCNDKMLSNNVNFTLNLPNEPMYVKCNSVEISQVLLNLLNNSIDAVESLPNKSVTLSLEKKSEKILLTVEDSGHIPPYVVPHLMEPFYTTKPVGKGTGLGLSISKSIADNHGAKLYYDKTKAHTSFVLEFENNLSLT